MKNLLLLLIPLVFIVSCKKEEAPEAAVQYNIFVNDWNPDLVGYSSGIPIDVTGGGQLDINYRVYGAYQWYDSAGHDVYFIARYEVLELIDTTFKIAAYNDTINPNLFAINEMINPSAKWESGLTLYGKRWWDHSNSNSNIVHYYNPFSINNGEAYLAITRNLNGDIYYGWVHLNVQPDMVTFYESGFNQIPNVPIQIGQTQ